MTQSGWAQQGLLDVKSTAAVEQLGERHLAMRRVDNVRLSDLHSTPIRAEAGRARREALGVVLLGQKSDPRLEPILHR
jgi:hypothetical protein